MTTLFFELERGLTVEITAGNEVLVKKSGQATVEFSGFPNYEEAETFVLFADYEPLEDNDFLKLTGRSYNLTYSIRG